VYPLDHYADVKSQRDVEANVFFLAKGGFGRGRLGNSYQDTIVLSRHEELRGVMG